MGPRTNPELFQAAATSDVLDRLRADAVRQEILGPVLAELSDAMDSTQGLERGNVTEPVMIPKLQAISVVRNTHLGIADYSGDIITANHRTGADTVCALAAPAHDSFIRDEDGLTIYTRVIRFENRSDRDEPRESDIEVFGLNLFTTADQSTGIAVKSRSRGHLAVAGKPPKPDTGPMTIAVSGETPIFVVHNKRTNAIVAYKVTIQSGTGSETPRAAVMGDRLNYELQPAFINNQAWIEYKSQTTCVELLSEELLRAVASEFSNAVALLRGQSSPDPSRAS